MPEGFEQFFKPKEIADLLAYLDSVSTPPRRFAGNRPALIQPDAAGALRLRSSNAEIHGDGIAFEARYQNIGAWRNANARVAWTVQLPAAASYDVWLHWACADDEAGDTFRFQLGNSDLTAKVPGTGSWDRFQSAKFGRLELPAGQHRAVFAADPALRGYLIDLLEVRLVPAGAAPPDFEPVAAGNPAR